MKTTAFVMTMLLTMLLSGVVSGQQKPTTGYAPVNGLKMYYEVHGSGEPVVLLHGAFMTAFSDDAFSLFDVNSSCGCQVPGLHEFVAINGPTTINLSLNLFRRAAQRERQFLVTRFESGVPDVL